MAPTQAATTEAVLSYMTAQNRPYSTNDIVLNLHNEHGKTAVQKALDGLTADGKITEKVLWKWNKKIFKF